MNLHPSSFIDNASTALSSYLVLSQEFVQDGFYTFEVDTKGFDIKTKDNSVQSADGRAIAMKGGNGEIRADMKFDDKGKVSEVAFDSSKLKQGPRPICQATKLLDSDSVVRRMAEADLLFMGLAARWPRAPRGHRPALEAHRQEWMVRQSGGGSPSRLSLRGCAKKRTALRLSP
jgi:hypothetical protein